jgi:hypothetical protein
MDEWSMSPTVPMPEGIKRLYRLEPHRASAAIGRNLPAALSGKSGFFKDL